MKKKHSINKNIIIFIICSFLSIILFFSKNINDFQYFRVHISNFFSIVFSPKQTLNNLSFINSENDSLILEIKKISQENLNLRQRIRTINTYLNYDKKLNKLISNHNFIPAKVLNHSLSKSTHIFNVNVGTKDGVPNKSKAVINYDGNLVGKTSVATKTTTQTIKISNRDFHVYVKTDNNVFGQFSYKSGKLGVIESVSKRDENLLNIGDIFYTTQNSNIYPENIPVAKVVDIQNRRYEHELYIKVEILADLNSLSNVFIIK
jgi:rod shape-determining protein MreC